MIHLKIVLSLFFILALNQIPYGQNVPEARFKFSVSAGSHLAKYIWDSPDRSLTKQFPDYRHKFGFIAGANFENRPHKSLYFKFGIDYLITNMALETGGKVLLYNAQGTQIVQCDWIDKRTHQLMANFGLGYRIISSLSLELRVFGITDLSIEKSKVCDFTTWMETYGQQKNSGFGVSPSIVYNVGKVNVSCAYGIELIGNRGTFFTDANGQDLGKFANQMQYFSLRLGYQIL